VLDELNAAKSQAEKDFSAVSSAEEMEKLRVKYLGKKGILREWTQRMGSLSVEERRAAGKGINELKQLVETRLTEGQAALKSRRVEERADVTVPGSRPPLGHFHPVTLMTDRLIAIFRGLGFEVAHGPEVEVERYNFDALNFPPDHPSRDGYDTFYIRDQVLLRSHTSPVQARVMENRKPPLRIVIPGRVYRPDTPDASHSPIFHQLEGLAVDVGIGFRDLKFVLSTAMQELYGADTRTRFRPSFFPFTEPSAEVDVSCMICRGRGCPACGQSGWIELLGAGMVHPNVFRFAGYDPEKYTGFAFGMGIDRIAMQWYGIHDIRLLLENDLRILRQF